MDSQIVWPLTLGHYGMRRRRSATLNPFRRTTRHNWGRNLNELKKTPSRQLLSEVDGGARGAARPTYTLRAAVSTDRETALRLYLDGASPLASSTGDWNEARLTERFVRDFKLEDAKVICLDGADVGWLQISETEEGIYLHQIHIEPNWQNRGVGAHLIEELQERGRHTGRPVLLNVLRGSRACTLYRRLGFRVVDSDHEKNSMRWDVD